MSKSLKFARALRREFRTSELGTLTRSYRVRGTLDVGPCVAKIEVFVPRRSADLVRVPPVVVCREPWIRVGAEWHNGAAGGMCWVLANQWRDHMGWRGKSKSAIVREGCGWLVSGVSSLVSRHYSAHLDGLERWPEEWAYWDHGARGTEQYERDKRQLCRPRRRR